MLFMLVSFNWLKQYLNLPDSITPEELADKLTMSTVEVEGIEKQSGSLEKIVVCRIEKIKRHPSADKLKVCLVNDGKETIQVVCGGSNLREKMKVAFAPIGVKVRWHGQGEPVEIKEIKIRGVESNGMICQSTEIGLGGMFPISDEAEIMDLNYLDSKLGMPLAQALGLDDVIFEIDNKSMTHRPDLWGHYGLAREVAALYGKELGKYEPPKIRAGKSLEIKVKIEDYKLCPRYMAVAVAGVKVESSPAWLQKRLLAVGLRPINNIVDITNYVLLDLGQPMHAFDADYLSSKKKDKKIFIVRPAKDKEEFEPLDGKKYMLDPSVIAVADQDKVVDLGGVMGGLNSGITDSTTTVAYEAANFDATTIRRTSAKLGIRTDSSTRFEKSLDPNHAELAMRRAVQLTLELCPGAKVISNIADAKEFNLKQGPIELSWDFLWKKLGKELDKKQVIKILQSLGFTSREEKEGLRVRVPAWRATKDISLPEDLVEEIARIYGYDNIEPKMPLFPIEPPEANELRRLERQVLDILVKDLGYNEVYNYSFVSAEQIVKAGDDVGKYIALDNPISKEKPYLRRNLILNLLENAVKNTEFYFELRLVEIGKTFLSEAAGVQVSKNSDELLPRQDVWLTAVYVSKKDDHPYWQARRVVETLCDYYGLDFTLDAESKLEPWRHPSRFGGLVVNGVDMGSVYEIHPLIAGRFGLETRVAAVDINLNKLVRIACEGRTAYQPLPAYPEVVRDLAVVLKTEIVYDEVIKIIRSVDSLLKKAELFDVYGGENIGEGRKSMAFRLTYGSDERTLSAGEVDAAQAKIVEQLRKKFKAEVRR